MVSLSYLSGCWMSCRSLHHAMDWRRLDEDASAELATPERRL